MKIIPIILLGGSGSRLWPVSRKNYPKQFLKLIGNKTLLQSTLLRLDGIDGLDSPIVICNEEHRFTTAEQLSEINKDTGDVILEPVGKNTAPAVIIGALRALQRHEDALLLVLPADHIIKDTRVFQAAVKNAVEAAKKNYLVTFGVVPTKPDTAYGYVKRGNAIDIPQMNNNCLYSVSKFVEKPDFQVAQSYVNTGEYYWNSGMFLFKASIFLEEIKQFQPEMLTCCQKALDKSTIDLDFIRLDRPLFRACPSNSVDYALMEKTKKAVMVSLDAGWNDVGSWDALWEIGEKDADANALRGDVLVHDTHDCLVRAENKLVTLVGVDNLIVIETKDAVLVAAKNKVQDVKSIVQKLNDGERYEAALHREVFRPWGGYDCIDVGNRFQVKRITVKPGESTSLQKHYHRSEHWIIVTGVAEITCGDKVFLCPENQSAYIPLGSTHRISNPGKLPMEMIEVQTGSYLGEDDIVRVEDYYGRAGQGRSEAIK